MNQNPKISFIVINYNGIKDTRDLLISIRTFLLLPTYEVVIVDNGSLTNEAEILKIDFPEYKYIRSDKNLGFSGGNNLGIKQSIGEYIMLLNNDTLLFDDSIYSLPEIFANNPKIAVISPKILFSDPRGIIQFAGFTELSTITLRNRAIGYMEVDNGQYNSPLEIASAHGAAMMIKRDVIEKVGLMPEIYFLYYEEFDWCFQIKKAGYEIVYQPISGIIHKDGQTVNKAGYIKLFYMTRNRMLYAFRNRTGLNRIMAIAYQLFFAVPKNILKSILNGKYDNVKAFISGTVEFFKLKNKLS